MRHVTVVDIIPNNHSNETNQDSEPSIAVNPSNSNQIVITAFTPPDSGVTNGPLFFSLDGGATWTLNFDVPGGGPNDQSVGFAGSSELYLGILRGDIFKQLNFLPSNNPGAPGALPAFDARANIDQPWIESRTVVGGGDNGKDRVYLAYNDDNVSQSATIDVCLDARAATPTFIQVRLESRSVGSGLLDGYAIRPVAHSDGTVYAVYEGWRAGSFGGNITTDIVVVRDDNWGSGSTPFTALTDPSDSKSGRLVATGVVINDGGFMGQERLNNDLTIAVDPTNSSVVYVAWSDNAGPNYTLRVRRSVDRGESRSGDLLAVDNATMACLAINSDGKVGLMHQRLNGGNWETHFQRTTDSTGANWDDVTLSNSPANTPAKVFDPYLGDWARIVSVGQDFFGVFCANNTPNPGNFPSGVTFLRNHTNSAPFQLLGNNGTTVIGTSIDPFFFRISKDTPDIIWPPPADIVYGTALTGVPGGQLNATASVPGIFNYNHAVGDCLPAGAYTLNLTFTPNDLFNFNPVTVSVPLTVRKATPLMTWANPPDIDHGDPLPAAALDATTSWDVCGTLGPVLGVFTYDHAPGDILPIGTDPLSVTFTPTDTANYNPATATVLIHVLTGYPIILSCSFAPTTLPREERTQVIVVVKNDSIRPHPTQGPNPGFEYSEGDTYLTGARPGRESFPPVEGAYRIAVDLDMIPYPYHLHHLYRWGFGPDLAPGESVTVNGYIRFHNSRQNAPYYVSMIQEVDNVVLDHQCTTLITVLRP